MNKNTPNLLSEHERLYRYRSGEKPLVMSTSIAVKSADDEEWLERVLTVMELIVKNADNWPDDDYWRQTLPEWLLNSFKEYTQEEIAARLADRSTWGNLQWSFGSWLDRMRDRSWEWWSVARTSDGAIINVKVDGYPFSTKTLEHLIYAAGGKVMQ